MKSKIPILALILVLSLLAAGIGLANGDVKLPRWVLGGGTSDAAAEGVALRGTLGQPFVDTVSKEGVALRQGFWHGVRPGNDIYLPLVINNVQPFESRGVSR